MGQIRGIPQRMAVLRPYTSLEMIRDLPWSWEARKKGPWTTRASLSLSLFLFPRIQMFHWLRHGYNYLPMAMPKLFLTRTVHYIRYPVMLTYWPGYARKRFSLLAACAVTCFWTPTFCCYYLGFEIYEPYQRIPQSRSCYASGLVSQMIWLHWLLGNIFEAHQVSSKRLQTNLAAFLQNLALSADQAHILPLSILH